MGLALDRKTLWTGRSDRVKAVDFHPNEPWLLVSLYNGLVNIWNYQTQTLVKSIEVTDVPVRAARFISRRNWLITGSDDLIIRVFNYNTGERVASFDAHADYIRSIAVHPTRPLVLSCSDDLTVKLWDWEKGWKQTALFEGHQHFVMAVAFNPKDPNTFATASLDRTVKVWSLGNTHAPNYTLEGHVNGVNSLAYVTNSDRPYLLTGADDKTVRVWDYQTRAQVRTLEGHTANVSAVAFHPELPLIISSGEDGTVRLWNSNTFRAEATLNFALERVWTLAVRSGGNEVAIGCDEGAVAIQLGRTEPAASMDSQGKVVWARHNEILTCSLRSISTEGENEPAIPASVSIQDGEPINIMTKELGHCEMFPQQLKHSPTGRFVAVCGDGEYIIYTALAWRNKSFGKALDFCWRSDSNDYAVRESASKISVFKNFKESGSVKLGGAYEAVFGGELLGIACAGASLCFYDWETLTLVRRIDVAATGVFWSTDGSKRVAICSKEAFYLLQYNPGAFESFMQDGEVNPEEGVGEAFELLSEVNETVDTGCWAGDCFIYTDANCRVSYFIGGQINSIAISDRLVYLLGYLTKENRVFLMDKDCNVISYGLLLAVIEYQSAVLRGDMRKASELLPMIGLDQRNQLAKFLESQGLLEEALEIATDAEFRFELALQLRKLDIAYELASTHGGVDKWRLLGDRALGDWKSALAAKCFERAEDLASLLLLHAASADSSALASLATIAADKCQYNIAFVAAMASGRVGDCLELLWRLEKWAEAAFFARCHLPSRAEEAVGKWKEWLEKNHRKVGKLLAEPAADPDHFPDFKKTLEGEKTRGYSGKAAKPAPSQQSSITVFSLDDTRTTTTPATSSVNLEEHSLQSPQEGTFSDHMSMEVNTTGTCSVRAEDLDDMPIGNIRGAGIGEDSLGASLPKTLEGLSIHEEVDEDDLDCLGNEPPRHDATELAREDVAVKGDPVFSPDNKLSREGGLVRKDLSMKQLLSQMSSAEFLDIDDEEAAQISAESEDKDEQPGLFDDDEEGWN